MGAQLVFIFNKRTQVMYSGGLPRWLSGKESACQGGDGGSIPGSATCPGEGNGNPSQYSCLGNPWTEESGRVQSMGSQKSWTHLSN